MAQCTLRTDFILSVGPSASHWTSVQLHPSWRASDGTSHGLQRVMREEGWRSQYVYHFFPGSQTLSGHISINKMIRNKNSSDVERAPTQKFRLFT